MSRMKSLAVAALHAGAGMAAVAASTLTNAVHTGSELIFGDRAERRRKARRQGAKTRYRTAWHGRFNRYTPHQGKQEIARRSRQIEAGKLRFFVPGVTAEAIRFEPTPVKASVVIENGLEAERRAKNRLRAEKAARTRAANKAAKLEAANG